MDTTKTQDKAIEELAELGTPESELKMVNAVIAASDALLLPETRAMRLVREATGAPKDAYPQDVADDPVSGADQALTPEEKLQRAQQPGVQHRVHRGCGDHHRPARRVHCDHGARTRAELAAAQHATASWINVEIGVAISLLVGVAAILALFNRKVSTVITRYTSSLHAAEERDLRVMLEPGGVAECTTWRARSTSSPRASPT